MNNRICFKIDLWCMMVGLILLSCGNNGDTPKAAVSPKQTSRYDIDEIEESGEIIATTMYGRDTYFEYHDKEMGTAYELLCEFAKKEGIGVRVETAADTTEMIKMLKSGDADIILTPINKNSANKNGLVVCGMRETGKESSIVGWAVRSDQPDLAKKLNEWYKPELLKLAFKEDRNHSTTPFVKRHIRAPYVSRSKGIISSYDKEFIRGSRHVGWDWRLIAAQCYQESGFDPNAVSWAGAKGLMQIIPSTAKSLNVTDVFNPQENIDAGCRYLKRLQNSFSDIRNRVDKIRFTLAAYNGGPRHIRDAMNLAKKYGKDPTRYEDVSFYIRNLDKPKYYNDPVVKYGFMIGSETYNYVESIMSRWEKYRGGKAVATLSDDDSYGMMPRKSRHNRFTRGKSEIVNLKDSL